MTNKLLEWDNDDILKILSDIIIKNLFLLYREKSIK